MSDIFSRVKGTTAVFTVIGCPVKHSFSPVIHNTMASITGKDFIYTAMEVQPDCVQGAIKGAYCLGIKGINVTVPHKVAVMDLLCDIDKRARAIGAVNTLKYTDNGYVGYNTDVIGVSYAIKNAGYTVKDKTVLLLGAGGAANACGVMACDEGCKKLVIANRTVEKAKRLAKNISAYYDCDIEVVTMDSINDIEHCDIIINATTVGFGDKVGLSPVKDRSFYKAKGVDFVFDAIYTPWQTQLLKDAEAEGVATLNGFSMLVYQAVAAEEIWFDEKYDIKLQGELCNKLSKYFRENANG